MKKLNLILICMFLLVAIVQAESSYKQSTAIDLKIPCINNQTFCSGSATCNLTIFNPDTSVLIEGKGMDNKGTYHNYSLNAIQTSIVGEHNVIVSCQDGGDNGYSTFNYQITPSGNLADEGMGSSVIAIVVFVIGLSFLFIYLAINLKEEHEILSILFLLSAILIMVIGAAVVNNITGTFVSESLQSGMSSLYRFMIVIFVIVMLYVILNFIIQILWLKKEGWGGNISG